MPTAGLTETTGEITAATVLWLSLEWMKYKEPPAPVPESAVDSEAEATQTELEKGDGA